MGWLGLNFQSANATEDQLEFIALLIAKGAFEKTCISECYPLFTNLVLLMLGLLSNWNYLTSRQMLGMILVVAIKAAMEMSIFNRINPEKG